MRSTSSWPHARDRVEGYTVLRGDEIIAKDLKENSFIDTAARPGIENDYSIETVVSVPEDEWSDSLVEDEIVAIRDGAMEAPTRGVIWGVPILIPAERSVESALETMYVVEAAAAVATMTHVRYATFIPQQWVERDGNQQFFCQASTPSNASRTFTKGDNRSWNTSAGVSSASHRTQVVVGKNWTSSGNASITSKTIGATGIWYTIGSAPAKYFYGQATASNSGITLSPHSAGTQSAVFTIRVEARNPWCASTVVLPIYGRLYMSVQRSGSYVVSGERRPVPNHEAYINYNTGSTKRIFRLSNLGFHCLGANALCSMQPISVTGSGL